SPAGGGAAHHRGRHPHAHHHRLELGQRDHRGGAMSLQLSRRARRVAPSEVREILKVAEQPDVLSFAGGLPAPELFPVEAIAQAHATVLARDGRAALQYSTTEGYGPLREWVVARMARRGIKASVEQVLITNGSQQG